MTPDEAKATCRLLASLLLYPSEAWAAELPELRRAVAEWPEVGAREALSAFLDTWDDHPLDRRQAEYVKTFDLRDRATLYLTHHVFGDEKERQQTPQRGYALVQLGAAYAEAGYHLTPDELPDYLPVVLEFAADADDSGELIRYGSLLLSAVRKVQRALAEQSSPYAPLLEAAHAALSALWKPDEREDAQRRVHAEPSGPVPVASPVQTALGGGAE